MFEKKLNQTPDKPSFGSIQSFPIRIKSSGWWDLLVCWLQTDVSLLVPFVNSSRDAITVQEVLAAASIAQTISVQPTSFINIFSQFLHARLNHSECKQWLNCLMATLWQRWRAWQSEASGAKSRYQYCVWFYASVHWRWRQHIDVFRCEDGRNQTSVPVSKRHANQCIAGMNQCTAGMNQCTAGIK
jgi:hypothetical protein